MRQRQRSLAANPVLIGAATVLVVLVGVFLAYNANSGLPFVPTYNLKVEVPNAAQLVKGNEVRIGGTRVGIVQSIGTKQYEDGRTTAILDLKLETTVEPLPKDSTILIRPRSALGLKYVSITKGTSSEGWAAGSTLPITAARPRPVELDEVLNTFNEPTRRASQVNLKNFGDAFAGRGAALNRTIEELNPLLLDLAPVMKNLAKPETGLGNLLRALQQTAAEVAPVAEEQAQLFVNLDTTFAALAEVAPDITLSTERAPAALQQAIESFRIQQPFLKDSTEFFAAAQPAAKAVRAAAPDLANTVEVGLPVLEQTPAFNAELTKTLEAVQTFSDDPSTDLGLRGLTTLVQILTPTLGDLTPTQTVCNYIGIAVRNVSSLFSGGPGTGTVARASLMNPVEGPNASVGPASAPAAGGGKTPLKNWLHLNPYPNTGQPGSNNECEAGRETYIPGQVMIGNPPGNSGSKTDRTVRGED
ncbi:MAG: MCE family protein [Solirubrobacteraceae bacterium]|nr:MCE family protein [Solirubrobacteraceae bacterium]